MDVIVIFKENSRMSIINFNENVWRKIKKISRKNVYEFFTEEIQNLPSGTGEVLNVGAGGEIEKFIKPLLVGKGYRFRSIDIDEKRHPDLVGDICNLKIGDSIFDLIIIAEVFEHLHSPSKAVENIHGMLKKDGVLLVTVPFIFPIHDEPCDYQRWTIYGLRKLFESSFSFLEIKARNNWAEAVVVLCLRLVNVQQKSKIKRVVRNFIVEISLILYPLASILGRFIISDAITTGYLLKGKKNETML